MDELKQFVINKQLRGALASVGYKDTEVGDVGGDTIFTNEVIKNEFLQAISGQDTFKPIQKTISRLIDIDVIVPAKVKTGLMSKIIYFFFKNKRKFAQSSFCMAFFDFHSGKIFVLVENISNIDYWKKSEALSLVLLHEFQHMTSSFFPTSFMRMHGKSLVTFYKDFFKIYFGANVSDKNVYKLINWIHIQTETTKGRATLGNQTIEQYYNLMWNMLKPSYKSTNQLTIDLHAYFNSLFVYLRNPSIYAQSIASKDPTTFKLYSALKESYKSLKILQRVDSLCVQEVIFPGEVICIESEYNTQNRHLKLIIQIKK